MCVHAAAAPRGAEDFTQAPGDKHAVTPFFTGDQLTHVLDGRESRESPHFCGQGPQRTSLVVGLSPNPGEHPPVKIADMVQPVRGVDEIAVSAERHAD